MKRTWNRTKIVCTIGPSSNDPATIERMLEAGMDVARLNFSHGTHEQHRAAVESLRRVSAKRGWPLAILLDLQGPRIRIGTFEKGEIRLAKKDRFTITTRRVQGGQSIVSTSYKGLPRDVKAGDRILLADGKVELLVEKVRGEDVRTQVVAGGALGNHKGMNIPNAAISLRTITLKDIADLKLGAAMGVDFIAVSFVRSPGDILAARRVLRRAGRGDIPVIAKIERPEAIDNLEEILAAADGVMVARGDLAVELSPEVVPLLQKRIIRRANELAKPVITATQMLYSMVSSLRPTRAEASDVANAILDGTDAVMLSEESAAGSYPVQAVHMLSRIAEEVEIHIPACDKEGSAELLAARDGSDPASCAVADVVPLLAVESGARCVCAFTRSGATALMVAKNRPVAPILGLTPDETALRRMGLYWGVEPVLVGEADDIQAMTRMLDDLLPRAGRARRGDRVVVVAGFPFGRGVHSNMVFIHRIG